MSRMVSHARKKEKKSGRVEFPTRTPLRERVTTPRYFDELLLKSVKLAQRATIGVIKKTLAGRRDAGNRKIASSIQTTSTYRDPTTTAISFQGFGVVGF